MQTSLDTVIDDLGRLAAVHAGLSASRGSQVALDEITRLASRLMHTPVALVSLVGSECQFFVGQSGLGGALAATRQNSLKYSFCKHVVATGAPLIVPDARLDDRLKDNPAISEYGVIAYAGFPINVLDNETIGSFCVVDQTVRDWTSNELEMLEAFSSVAVIAIQRDIEAQRRMNAEKNMLSMEHVNMLGRMSAGIVHDFNNLLSVVSGNAYLLKQVAPPECNKYVDRILDTVSSSQRLTRHLLQYSKGTADNSDSSDAGAVIRSMTELLCTMAGSKVETLVSTDTMPMHIALSQVQLEQILSNLVVNARDAMPGGGRILDASACSFDTAQQFHLFNIPMGDYARLTVRDNGQGIPQEIQMKIFEPFFTTKPADKGTGIGLSTIYNLVRDLKGAIDLKSVTGQGTCFEIYLPMLENEALVFGR